MSHDPETSRSTKKQSNCNTSDQNDQRNNNATSKAEKTKMTEESTKKGCARELLTRKLNLVKTRPDKSNRETPPVLRGEAAYKNGADKNNANVLQEVYEPRETKKGHARKVKSTPSRNANTSTEVTLHMKTWAYRSRELNRGCGETNDENIVSQKQTTSRETGGSALEPEEGLEATCSN